MPELRSPNQLSGTRLSLTRSSRRIRNDTSMSARCVITPAANTPCCLTASATTATVMIGQTLVSPARSRLLTSTTTTSGAMPASEPTADRTAHAARVVRADLRIAGACPGPGAVCDPTLILHRNCPAAGRPHTRAARHQDVAGRYLQVVRRLPTNHLRQVGTRIYPRGGADAADQLSALVATVQAGAGECPNAESDVAALRRLVPPARDSVSRRIQGRP